MGYLPGGGGNAPRKAGLRVAMDRVRLKLML